MTDEEPDVPLFGHVVGENFRRLREARGLTQVEAATELRRRGLPWARSQVAALESGSRESVDGPALLLLAEALKVEMLAELFEGDGRVRLTDGAVVTRSYVRARLSGRDARRGSGTARLIVNSHGSGTAFQADVELAQRLGIRPEVVYRAAEELWGRTLHQERDRRVAELGEMSSAQRRVRRGHVTRQLTQELAPHLPAHTDQQEGGASE